MDITSIFQKLSKYKHLGIEHTNNGATLIGKLPKLASEAWLHQSFKGLNEGELKELEVDLTTNIPEDFRSFLRATNGLNLFSTTISIFGRRKSNSRDAYNFEPFDIKTPNLFERPKDAKKNCLFIGSYNWDGSLIFIEFGETDTVYRCERYSSTNKLNSWINLASMLDSEIDRLSSLFDDQGYVVNDDLPTTPP